jgi:hypothetical protein
MKHAQDLGLLDISCHGTAVAMPLHDIAGNVVE